MQAQWGFQASLIIAVSGTLKYVGATNQIQIRLTLFLQPLKSVLTFLQVWCAYQLTSNSTASSQLPCHDSYGDSVRRSVISSGTAAGLVPKGKHCGFGDIARLLHALAVQPRARDHRRIDKCRVDEDNLATQIHFRSTPIAVNGYESASFVLSTALAAYHLAVECR